jgi:hypothetical protein
MAKPRKKRKKDQARRLHREPIVREVARLLDTGQPTKFRWESACRRGLRAAMCLKGAKWEAADDQAARIVSLAFCRIGVSRPPWHLGQPEPEAREYWYCAGCGGFMGANDKPFCSEECRLRHRERDRWQSGRRDDEARRRAVRVILTGGAEPAPTTAERQCRKCGKLFKPKPGHKLQRYCGRSCSAKREKYTTRACLVCAEPFQPHQHRQVACGPACAHEALRRRLRQRRAALRPETKPCRMCGQPFPWRKGQLYCAACTPLAAKARQARYARRQAA